MQPTKTRRARRRDPEGTRERLLGAGFQEIHREGFQPASLDAIVVGAGVTKGALYHHFENKRALGYAVLDEVIGGLLDQHWLAPLVDAVDPIESLVDAVRVAAQTDHCELGCPLNNLAQEMSATDQGFQRRVDRLYRRWESGFAAALERGQADGVVRADVDTTAVATFLVSSIEGALGLAKNRKDPQPLHACVDGLGRYLETLRAVPERGSRPGPVPRPGRTSRRPDERRAAR